MQDARIGKKRLLRKVIHAQVGLEPDSCGVGSRRRADELHLLPSHRLRGGQRSAQAKAFPFLQKQAFLNHLCERVVADLIGGLLQGRQEIRRQRARLRLLCIL